MVGTIINIITIFIGGGLGVLLGNRLPERLRQTVMAGLGLFTFAFAFQMFTGTKNSLLVLGSLLIGALLGEWLKLEERVSSLGAWLETRTARGNGRTTDGRERFIQGFLVASLLFCIGPMAILGSVQDGLSGDFRTLTIKAILDGFASLAFASSLGIGVLFSALPLFIYQGGITLLAAQVQSVMTTEMMTEMSATGGLILMAIAISSLLEIKKIRTASFLPSLVIAPLLVAILALMGLK